MSFPCRWKVLVHSCISEKKEGKILSKDLKLWQEGNKIPHCTTTCQQLGAQSCSHSCCDLHCYYPAAPFQGDVHTSDLGLFVYDLWEVRPNLIELSILSQMASLVQETRVSRRLLVKTAARRSAAGASLTHGVKILIWPARASVLESSVRKQKLWASAPWRWFTQNPPNKRV